MAALKVGYSRISDEAQSVSDPLATATRELTAAGAELVLVEIGSGRSDENRPKFRQLREMVLDGKVTTVITPSQDRLGRNTELVLQFAQLCSMQGVQLLDLNGRELEVRTADGRLMTTIVAALDQHRSDLYSEKVRRAMKSAKEQGLPVRSKLPFGLRKVRNEAGRFTSVEIDPVTGPLARQRIDWFLKEDLSLISLVTRINDKQPGWSMSRRSLSDWLKNPMLKGHYCWGRDKQANYSHISTEKSFPALITDAEHEAIVARINANLNVRGRRGRKLRPLSGLCRCSKCGVALTYKTFKHSEVVYLRCSNSDCDHNSKAINADQVMGVLQFSLAAHAETMLPVLSRPQTIPPEVSKLQQEIKTLQAIAGTEDVVTAKQLEINRLKSQSTDQPGWLLVGAMRSQAFWLQSDEVINHTLRMLLHQITVNLTYSVKTAHVAAVQCKTVPSEAPLPNDQHNILIPITGHQLAITAKHQQQIQEALAAIGCH